MSGLSCSAACGILVPQPDVEPTSPALQGGFSTSEPQVMKAPQHQRFSCLLHGNMPQLTQGIMQVQSSDTPGELQTSLPWPRTWAGALLKGARSDQRSSLIHPQVHQEWNTLVLLSLSAPGDWLYNSREATEESHVRPGRREGGSPLSSKGKRIPARSLLPHQRSVELGGWGSSGGQDGLSSGQVSLWRAKLRNGNSVSGILVWCSLTDFRKPRWHHFFF